ncbi:thiamine metabolism- protein, partial [Teratosphaeriaceae sp. CCFEE 6253]
AHTDALTHPSKDAPSDSSPAPATIPSTKIDIGSINKTVPVNGQTKQKTIEAMAGAWSDFKFAHIRESQVSRAMTRRYFEDLD